MKRVVIVMPTYNEVSNITEMLDEIMDIKVPKHEVHVLVVDDNSPDGTGSLVKAYPNKRVHLFRRETKEGLGRAYIAGMLHALDTLHPDIVMEMDADFSHDPQAIPLLVDAIDKGADFVIGSRYVPGGKIPEGWGPHRVLISRTANLATRTILGIQGVKDCSGGFRAIRADLLRKIDLEHLHVNGYAFQAVRQNAIVAEVPITFANRRAGDSKMSFSDMMEGFTALTRVRFGARARQDVGQEAT
jgi:dolichol-phosphate mannosyltransferase